MHFEIVSISHFSSVFNVAVDQYPCVPILLHLTGWLLCDCQSRSWLTVLRARSYFQARRGVLAPRLFPPSSGVGPGSLAADWDSGAEIWR